MQRQHYESGPSLPRSPDTLTQFPYGRTVKILSSSGTVIQAQDVDLCIDSMLDQCSHVVPSEIVY